MLLEAGPIRSAIVGSIDATARTSTELSVGMHLRLPHPGEQDVRIVRVHRQAGAANILTGEQNPFPVLAAIRSSKDAPFLLRPCHAA